MNNKIRIKVCGMRDPENILQVSELHPDYMGFIFYPKSKRFVGTEFQIPEQLPKEIKRVGVFVNETTDNILALAKAHSLDFIQLHGNESAKQCVELKQNSLGVIKVFQVDAQFDFSEIDPYKKVVNYFLFDTKSTSYGGTGKSFDWNLLKQYDQEIPFFLSGGLSISNIEKTKEMNKMNLHALDINSGVEISPGLKAIEKIKELKQILFT
jgi:phosphoribosylanthranilate isomerase